MVALGGLTQASLRRLRVASFPLALLLLPCALAQGPQETLEQTFREQVESDTDAARSQTRITQLADETAELLGDYRETLQALDRARVYNDNLEALVASQEASKASILQQLDDFVIVEQGIVPLMFDMIDVLERFIALDTPFQLRERIERARRLRDNMDDAEITISEKYRQLMDAYLIETEFGRTIEAYIDTLEIDGAETQVDVLRFGRVLLAYQTPDRASTGYFNPQTRAWEPLPDDYRAAVTLGLRIARRQAAPDLLRLPVQAAGSP
ncbi:MAG TPA: DUF3450 domain-containing protein [Gammaproteobacteria bacterium]